MSPLEKIADTSAGYWSNAVNDLISFNYSSICLLNVLFCCHQAFTPQRSEVFSISFAVHYLSEYLACSVDLDLSLRTLFRQTLYRPFLDRSFHFLVILVHNDLRFISILITTYSNLEWQVSTRLPFFRKSWQISIFTEIHLFAIWVSE